jgi:hypothetical protein
VYVITGLFRVGVNTIREKKSYFFSVLNSLNTLLLSSLHGLRRNICDNGTVFVIFFAQFAAMSWRNLVTFSKIEHSGYFTKKVSKKCRQVLRNFMSKRLYKKLSRFQLACRLPLESVKICFTFSTQCALFTFLFVCFFFANFHCSYFSVPLSDLFANTLKTE